MLPLFLREERDASKATNPTLHRLAAPVRTVRVVNPPLLDRLYFTYALPSSARKYRYGAACQLRLGWRGFMRFSPRLSCNLVDTATISNVVLKTLGMFDRALTLITTHLRGRDREGRVRCASRNQWLKVRIRRCCCGR